MSTEIWLIHRHDSLGPRDHTKKAEDALQVFLDRPRADTKRQGDFFIREAFLKTGQHIALSL